MGRVLVGIGALLLVAGLVVMGLERAGVPLGRLPGDLRFNGKHVQVFAPLMTSLLLSVLLSLGLFLLSRLRR